METYHSYLPKAVLRVEKSGLMRLDRSQHLKITDSTLTDLPYTYAIECENISFESDL
jgi:hypothetical protein